MTFAFSSNEEVKGVMWGDAINRKMGKDICNISTLSEKKIEPMGEIDNNINIRHK